MNKLESCAADLELEADLTCNLCGKEYNCDNTEESYQFSVYGGRNNTNIDEYYQHYNVCSLTCYLKQIKKSVNNLERSKNGTIDGMDVDFAKKLLFFYGIE